MFFCRRRALSLQCYLTGYGCDRSLFHVFFLCYNIYFTWNWFSILKFCLSTTIPLSCVLFIIWYFSRLTFWIRLVDKFFCSAADPHIKEFFRNITVIQKSLKNLIGSKGLYEYVYFGGTLACYKSQVHNLYSSFLHLNIFGSITLEE